MSVHGSPAPLPKDAADCDDTTMQEALSTAAALAAAAVATDGSAARVSPTVLPVLVTAPTSHNPRPPCSRIHKPFTRRPLSLTTMSLRMVYARNKSLLTLRTQCNTTSYRYMHHYLYPYSFKPHHPHTLLRPNCDEANGQPKKKPTQTYSYTSLNVEWSRAVKADAPCAPSSAESYIAHPCEYPKNMQVRLLETHSEK